jgi:hypothetical protein
MNKTFYLWLLMVSALQSVHAGSNLLQNSSFELSADGNNATYWTYGLAGKTNGGSWGSSARRNWRAKTGSWMGAIQGTWFNGQDFGGWWQENQGDTPIAPGLIYEAGAWLWADNQPGIQWTCTAQRITIEFYDSDYNLLSSSATNFTGEISSNWVYKSIRAIAPAGTFKARLAIKVDGAGSAGALQIDDAELRSITTRAQDFNDWSTYTNDAAWTRDDWVLSTGKVVATYLSGTDVVSIARSGWAAGLPATNGVSNGVFVRSASLAEGVGTIQFWYRHGSLDLDNEPTNPLSLRIEYSENGTAWLPLASISNIVSTDYRTYNQYQNLPDARYVRVLRTDSQTNRLYLDDISIDQPSGIPRVMDFSTWPTNNTTNGCYSYLFWDLCTGRIDKVMALSDQAAVLPGNSNNYLRSPLFADGYGTVSFQYRRGTNGLGPASLAVQASTNGSLWTTIGAVSNITGTGFLEYNQFFYVPVPNQIRVINNSLGTAGSTLFLDESFINGQTPPDGWNFTGVGEYTSESSSGLSPKSVKFDSTGDRIESPPLNNPTSVVFWTKGNPGTGSTGSLLTVEQYIGSTWSTAATLTISSTAEITNRISLTSTATRIAYQLTKQSYNVAFDDLQVFVAPLPAQPPQDLVLDNIAIATPVLKRLQNFNEVPASSGYVTIFDTGWVISNALIETASAYQGQAARLRNASGSLVQSPLFPDGIGPVSFQARHWSSNGTVNLQIQVSTNGAQWTTNTTVAVTGTTYQLFSAYLFNTNPAAVRIWNPGTERVYLDDVEILAPQPPADVVLNGYTEPRSPFTNDAVYLWASAQTAYRASIISITSYYRIGTSGAFTARGMSRQDLVNYRATNTIPPQTNGTIVQYYLRADFGGPGATNTSPKFYPSGGATNPAFYAIARARSGQVWFNEVNLFVGLFSSGTPADEFVELGGPAGFNLSGWRLVIADGASTSTNALAIRSSYLISSPTFLPTDTPSNGFWLIGGTNIASRDATLTNSMTELNASGIYSLRLLNESGGIEQSICLGGKVTDSEYIGKNEDIFIEDSVGLEGSGTGYSNFTWAVTTNMTPGSVNSGQNMGTTAAPDTWLVNWSHLGVNWTVVVIGNTNNWQIAPRYASALNNPTPTWITVPGFSVATNGIGTNTVTFTAPGTNSYYFFQMLLLP